MTDKQINRWLRKRFSSIGWILIGYNLLLTTLVTVAAVVDYMKQILWNLGVGVFFLDFNEEIIWNNGWGYIVASVTVLVILYAWKGPGYWRQELFARGRKMTIPVFVWSMILCMGCQMMNSFWLTGLELVMNSSGNSIMPVLESVSGESSSVSMFLYGAVLAPVCEELIFRGYVLRTLRPFGKRFAIFGSALLFALFHGNLLQGPYALLVGLILGYLASEYSITWAIGLHVFNNLVLAEGLTRLMELLPLPVADLLFGILFMGAFAASLLWLVKNRDKIRRWRQAEWMDSRCVKWFFLNPGMIAFLSIMAVSMVSLLGI